MVATIEKLRGQKKNNPQNFQKYIFQRPGAITPKMVQNASCRVLCGGRTCVCMGIIARVRTREDSVLCQMYDIAC